MQPTGEGVSVKRISRASRQKHVKTSQHHVNIRAIHSARIHPRSLWTGEVGRDARVLVRWV
ncbi:predicted protein [Botrytis cinerea T4]|uniref:Uncharacterized protein n=1 Tax=Botryotinia fuckeliana (strain T4) TaxID=999810 RepID=G2Y895_BOTF4|nr:predicted protein [Botrytis cinerea T4]